MAKLGKKAMIVTAIGRWILALLLLYGVYTETGIWTTIAIFLTFLSTELGTYFVRVVKKALDEVFD